MPPACVQSAAARRAAPLIMLSMLFAVGAFAALPDVVPPAQPARTAGLSFLIAKDLQLSDFDGALLSWRTRGEDGRGWRFGVLLSGSLRRIERREGGPDASHMTIDDRRSAAVTLTALRVHERPRWRTLGYYWAMGPMAGYYFSRETEDPDIGDRYYVRTNGWQVGLAGVAGVEWRANDGVSLLAEYGVSLGYAHQRSHVVYYDWGDAWSTHSSVQFDAREARLGLTAWFR